MPGVITVLINPSSLYSEGLIRILLGTVFQIAHGVRNADAYGRLAGDTERLFIIGGRDYRRRQGGERHCQSIQSIANCGHR